MSAYDFIAKFAEQGVKVCFAKFLEPFVQILLFAEASPCSHGIADRLYSSWSVYRVEAAQYLLQFLFETV